VLVMKLERRRDNKIASALVCSREKSKIAYKLYKALFIVDN
jgi:hypothetical protein